jgi:hypothetical protein
MREGDYRLVEKGWRQSSLLSDRPSAQEHGSAGKEYGI